MFFCGSDWEGHLKKWKDHFKDEDVVEVAMEFVGNYERAFRKVKEVLKRCE